MKPTRLFISLLALALAGLTAGCGKETPDHQESSADDAHAEGHDNNGEEGHDDHDEGGGESSATFKEGIGLVFPSDVLAAMGVRTAEVEERLLPLAPLRLLQIGLNSYLTCHPGPNLTSWVKR